MIMFNRVKIFICFTAFVSAFMIITTELYSESVFLKDGKIVEGTIVKEDDKKIEIKIEAGDSREIPRADIVRTLYHDKYKEKKFINKTDKKKIAGFIVEEDSESYTYRTELNSSTELKIAKDEVFSISQYKAGATGSEGEIQIYSSSGYYMRGIVPGWGQYYSGHNIKSSMFSVSFGASIIWMVYANTKYMQSRDKYDNLSDGHTVQEFDDAYNTAENDRKMAIWSVATVSLIYVLNWCDIIFFSVPEFTASNQFKYGGVYADLNMGSDYIKHESVDYDGGLKAEIGLSLKF